MAKQTKQEKVVFIITTTELPKGVTFKVKGSNAFLSFRDYNGWKYSIQTKIIEREGDDITLEVHDKEHSIFLKAEDMDIGYFKISKVVFEKETEIFGVQLKAKVIKEGKVTEKEIIAPAVAEEEVKAVLKEQVEDSTNVVDVIKDSAVITIINNFSTDPESPVNKLEDRKYPLNEVIEILSFANKYWDIPRIGACEPEQDLSGHVVDLVRDGVYTKVQVVALLQKELNSQGIFLDEAEKTTNQVIEWVKENPGKTVGIVAGAAAVLAGLALLGEKFLGGSDE
jgi:hypothetical protein|nr:MAG TPA: protein of unknown function (DUF883) [Caudoviricetes sp.]